MISTFHMPIYPLGLWSFIKSKKPWVSITSWLLLYLIKFIN
jgi:hypothetical protein